MLKKVQDVDDDQMVTVDAAADVVGTAVDKLLTDKMLLLLMVLLLLLPLILLL